MDIFNYTQGYNAVLEPNIVYDGSTLKAYYQAKNNILFEFIREERQFKYSQYSNYIIKIRILDPLLNITKLEIITNEKTYFYMIQSLFNFTFEYGYILSDVIYFEPDTNSLQPIIAISNKSEPYPIDDDIAEIGFGIKDLKTNKILIRYYDIWNYIDIENFVYAAYTLIQDLTYLSEFAVGYLQEIMEDC